jgi:hypothetical protein
MPELAQCTLRLRSEDSIYRPRIIALSEQGSLHLADVIAICASSSRLALLLGKYLDVGLGRVCKGRTPQLPRE